MKKIIVLLMCFGIFMQNSMAIYAADMETLLEQLQEEKLLEECEQVQEEEKKEDGEQVQGEEMENAEQVREEEKKEDAEQVQEEEKIEDAEQVQEEEKIEDAEQVQEEEKIKDVEQVQEKKKIEDNTQSQDSVEEMETILGEIGYDDPQYGRESGYLDENFFEMSSFYNEGTNYNYIHDSKFGECIIKDVIDVSKYQGEIDWFKVKQSGIEYAIIRAGFRGYGKNGSLNVDNRFVENIEGALAAGVEVGVYFFSQAITEEEALAEAAYVLDMVRDYEISLPIAIDFEYASSSEGLVGRLYDANLSKEEATEICKLFCATIEDAGYTPMVYANKEMLENGLNALEIAEDYKIWLANYTASTSYQGRYEFWQYTQCGTVDGISGNVDKSFWYKKTATVYNKIDYSPIYSFKSYMDNNEDIKSIYGNDDNEALKHFVENGMDEGRVGSDYFNVYAYKNRYADLRAGYGNNLKLYYLHYLNAGIKEGRNGLVDSEYETVYNGIDYSAVYDFKYYIDHNEDIRNGFGENDYAVLEHFVEYGMAEGRIGNEDFNIYTYRNRYTDLRNGYGKNWKAYYTHFLNAGQYENRDGSGISEIVDPITIYNGIDYSVVYDFEYYIEHNEDIKNAYIDDDSMALKHFVEYGMAEGRIGSEWFNVYTYRNRYADLKSGYGECWKLYYMHYINAGIWEERSGSELGKITECKITEGSKDTSTINFRIELYDLIKEVEEYYIIKVNSWDMEIEQMLTSQVGEVGENSIAILMSEKDLAKEALMDGFALAIKDADGKLLLASEAVSISNPEALAINTSPIFQGTSKKGLQGIAYSSYDGGSDIVDARNANTKHTLLNLDLASVVTTDPNQDGYIAYTYKGNTYYFSDLSDLKKNIQSLNYGYQQYLNGNTGRTPVAVSLCLLLSYNSENSYLIDPAARTPGHSYYMLNVREEKARETLEALFLYLGETFGQENCFVSNWILGNEINSSRAWNFNGNLDFDTYMECYATAFRLLYNGVKSEKTGNTVCVSLDNGWMAAPDTYAGKRTLDTFAQKIYAQNPNIEWSIAYHPYSYPLTKADFWNDYKNTTDSLSTPYISMRNINVLTDYAGTLESAYGRENGSIRVLLTEQGYSYAAGARTQAEAIARGYYIAEFNDRIDAFIIRAVVDDPDEASGRLYFGLMNSQHEKRIAFYVYEYMDSSRSGFAEQSSSIVSDENRNKFETAKSIVCDTNWSAIIPGFDDSKLAAIK